MRKILALTAACLLLSVSAALAGVGQQLTINGQTVEKSVTRITFDGDNVVLHFEGDDSQTADMETVVLGFTYSPTTAIHTLRGTVGNTLSLEGLDPGTEVCIYDAQGKLVTATTASEAKAVLSTKALKKGVYMLKAGQQAVKFIKR